MTGTLDPLLAARLPLLEGVPSWLGPMTPEQAERAQTWGVAIEGYVAPSARVADRAAPGPHGDVPVRVYAPTDGAPPTRGVVWCHGGAFVAGDLDMPEADVVARELVARSGGAGRVGRLPAGRRRRALPGTARRRACGVPLGGGGLRAAAPLGAVGAGRRERRCEPVARGRAAAARRGRGAAGLPAAGVPRRPLRAAAGVAGARADHDDHAGAAALPPGGPGRRQRQLPRRPATGHAVRLPWPGSTGRAARGRW